MKFIVAAAIFLCCAGMVMADVAPTNGRPVLLEGSVAAMEAALEGRTNTASIRLWSVKDDALNDYAWNTNNPFFKFRGVTSISALGDGSNSGQNGTLISPRLVIAAGHSFQVPSSPAFHYDTGPLGNWRFVDRNNKVYEAKGRASRLLTNWTTGKAVDMRIFVLSEPLPASVEPAFVDSLKLQSIVTNNFISSAHANRSKQLVPYSVRWTGRYWKGSNMFPKLFVRTRGGDSGSGRFITVSTNLVFINATAGRTVVMDGFTQTCEWLCTNYGYPPDLPIEIDLSDYEGSRQN